MAAVAAGSPPEVQSESNGAKAVVVKPKKAVAPRKKSPSTHPPFLMMIGDAIATLKERTGSSQYAIQKFTEEKQKQLPANFRKLLLLHLKRLVASGKLVKVKNSYKLPSVKAAAASPPKKSIPFKPKAKAVWKPKFAAKPKAKSAAAKPKLAAKPRTKTVTKPKPVVKPKAEVVAKPKAASKSKANTAASAATKRKAAEKPKPSRPAPKSGKISSMSSPSKKAAKPKKTPTKKITKAATGGRLPRKS
ncbi:hypothetical protein SAY86_030819 [Trapa natans]|uniref:H15 domain-containing protein n=1 Tax=Trapa natans TaxID=22666 RepID=A0AAN7LYF6_TRANT|nr:hypothetical protein SAY86_030819 [Trapa natans]